MTTPAVNRTTRSSSNPTRRRVRISNQGTQAQQTQVSDEVSQDAWDRQKRPASVGRPRVNGWRPPTAWSHEWDHVAGSGNTVYRTQKPGPLPLNTTVSALWPKLSYWSTGGKLPCDRSALPSVPNSAFSEAEIKALNKLQEGGFNLGVFLAELKQTVGLVANTANTIACGVKLFRQSNSKQIWNKIKRYQGRKGYQHLVPGKWLELQYGWNPLMSDIMAASSRVNKLDEVVGRLLSVQGKAKRSDEYKLTLSGSSGSTAIVRGIVEHVVRVKLWYKLMSPQVAELADLGLVNPALILWEKVPYSFVVDWFLPVGGWINSLTADAGYQFHAGIRSTMTKCEREEVEDVKWIGAGYEAWGTPYDTSGSYLGFRVDRGVFRRTLYNSTPVPGFYVKNPLSVIHAANAIALLMQTFRR